MELEVVRPIDPNDKVGPTGLGEQRVVASDSTLNYTINFENLATATAPVQELFIFDELDANLDWSTFQLTSIAYGDRVLPIDAPPGIFEFATQDYPPASITAGTTEGRLRIDISVQFNIQTGKVEWYLKTIDDATGDFPSDLLAGFLPPKMAAVVGWVMSPSPSGQNPASLPAPWSGTRPVSSSTPTNQSSPTKSST